jgi:hypothetical protein
MRRIRFVKAAARRLAWAPAFLLCLTLIADPPVARAHHGNAAFDVTKTVTLEGVVIRWQFINPHAGIWFEVAGADGQTVEWSGEFMSIQDLYRGWGWNKDTFKAGDRITVVGNPDRRGRAAVWVSKVVLPDGSEAEVRPEE